MILRSSLMAATALSLMLTTGCDKQASGQTVAVVNGEEISLSELNGEIALANLPPSVDKKQATAQLLQGIIDRKLMVQKAKEQGIDKTPEFISRQQRMTQELLINMASQRQADSMRLPDQRAVDGFIAANPTMFAQRELLTLSQLQFDAPKDRAAVDRFRNDHSLDALAATLTSLGMPFAKGSSKLDTASVPPPMVRQINDLPAGEPFIVPMRGKLIASVITAREPAALSPEESRKVAVDVLRRQNTGTAMQGQLKQMRDTAKIEYQSGYGSPPKPAGPAAKAPAAKS